MTEPRAKRRERSDTVYIWDGQEAQTKKARVERYSTKMPDTILLQNGLYVKSDEVFDQRSQADNFGKLASGSGAVKKEEDLATGSKGREVQQQNVEELAPDSVEELAPGSEAQKLAPGNDGGSEAENITAAEYCQHVAAWLDGKIKAALKSEHSLPGLFAKEFPMNGHTRQHMLRVVPWESGKGYTTMLRYPKSKCKGVLHVACFAYGENGFHGKGLYAVDAVAWLSNTRVPFDMKRLDVVPVLAPGSDSLSSFGYGCDGPMVNSTTVFALVALALYALETGATMPSAIVQELSGVRVQYTKHASGMDRLVANMVTSNVNSKINRSMDDPLLLAGELSRQGLNTTKEIRAVIRAYTARVMATPSLSLKRTTGDCTARLMDRSKMCEASVQALTRITQQAGWQTGPLSADALLAPKLTLGATLVDSSHEVWLEFAVMTAACQADILHHIENKMQSELAAGSSLTRYNQEQVQSLAIAVGLWRQIITHIAPVLLIPEGLVREVADQAFQGPVQSSLLELAATDPPDSVDDFSGLATFLLKNVPALKEVHTQHRRESQAVTAEHPSSVLNKTEMKWLAATAYMAELTMDANRYRDAKNKATKSVHELETKHREDVKRHVDNVKLARGILGDIDVRFVSPSTGGVDNRRCKDKHVIPLAVAMEEAMNNYERLKKVVAGSVVVLNVFALQTRGMLNKKMLAHIKSHVLMGPLPGAILFIYPHVPSGAYAAKRTVSAGGLPAASGASDVCDDENTDDSNSDDLGEDCLLPEVITRSVKTMSRWEKHAGLAADRFLIDSTLGQFNLSKYLPQPVTISHAETGGRRRVEKGLLLIPHPGSASGDSGDRDGMLFEKTALVRDGLYSNVEDFDEFVHVSGKVAQQCRKTQGTHWKTNDLSVIGRGYVANKDARGQVGWQTSATILKDLVKGCGANALLVNDFMAGVGEFGVAALHVRCSQEAKDANVRLCYWGYEDKRVFADIARANINTAFGKLYLEGRLVIPSLTPVPDPGPPAAAASGAPTKIAIMEMLGAPLKQLTIDDQGGLVIPALEAWEKDDPSPPVQMTSDLADYLETLHNEFPRTPAKKSQETPAPDGSSPTPAPGGREIDPPAPAPAPGGNPGNLEDNKPMLPSGTLFTNRSEFASKMQAAGCTIAKEATPPAEGPSALGEKYTSLLVRLPQPQDPWRVLIEAKEDICLKPGHFIGRAGHGSFVVWNHEEAPPDGMSNAWVYNRCNDYKKDIALRANGMWVLDTVSSTQPPVMSNLEDIQKELGDKFQTLWAHSITRGARGVRVAPAHAKSHVMWIPKMETDSSSFTMDCLNSFAPSWEVRDGDAGLECSGFLRPAFEVRLDGNQLTPGKGLGEPSAKNPVCLFVRKAIKLRRSQVMVL